MASSKPLTIKQLQTYPSAATTPVFPDATTDGYANISTGRGGPFKLHYQTYGQGPIKIIWISGHGAGLEDWVDIVKEFGGARNSDKYTSLIFESRGIGQSEGPWSMIWMKDLVQDTKDILDHVGWTEDKSVNIVGHSMGGMIAMQFAIAHPNLVKTLTLTSTTNNWLGTLSLWTATKSTLSALVPKSADTRLSETKAQLFSASWLTGPDPSGTFPTNGDAWAARSLTRPVYYKGAVLSAAASVRHKVSIDECKEVAKRIGKGNIMILQGKDDRMVPVETAEAMWRDFGAEELGVRVVILERSGHMPQVERLGDVIDLVQELVGRSEEESVPNEWTSIR